MAESIAGIVLLSASPPTLLFTAFHFQAQNIFELLFWCSIASEWLHLDAGLSLSSKAWIAPASRASVNVYGTRY